MERDSFDVLSNVNDDLRISIPKAFDLTETQLSKLYIKRWAEIKQRGMK
jgi:bacillopeptidase F (M6 metalloprotease family)